MGATNFCDFPKMLKLEELAILFKDVVEEVRGISTDLFLKRKVPFSDFCFFEGDESPLLDVKFVKLLGLGFFPLCSWLSGYSFFVELVDPFVLIGAAVPCRDEVLELEELPASLEGRLALSCFINPALTLMSRARILFFTSGAIFWDS